MQHRPAPDHRLVAGIEKSHRNNFQPMGQHRLDATVRIGLRLPASSQHQRDVRSVNVSVKQPNFVSQLAQRHRKVDGDSCFPHASLAGADGDNGVNARDGLRCGWLLTGMVRMCAQRKCPFRWILF